MNIFCSSNKTCSGQSKKTEKTQMKFSFRLNWCTFMTLRFIAWSASLFQMMTIITISLITTIIQVILWDWSSCIHWALGLNGYDSGTRSFTYIGRWDSRFGASPHSIALDTLQQCNDGDGYVFKIYENMLTLGILCGVILSYICKCS